MALFKLSHLEYLYYVLEFQLCWLVSKKNIFRKKKNMKSAILWIIPCQNYSWEFTVKLYNR